MNDLDVYKQDDGDRPVERSPRGRYIRFDIRLGSGAYKTVYKAYDTDQGIDVAWNAIDIGVLPSSEKARIIQEVQLLQKLEHKNIINFYGSWFSKEKNQVVFITEIMTSGNLKSYIKRVQFIKWKIIKRWCLQILEGLHYLHSQQPPVIHRDLKCDNIFINGNTGDLRIGDLGLSTQLAVHKRSAQSVLGTPEFMAPELYDESYDEKVDIYSFGMCVLEMVTKEVPYSECINPAQIYRKVTAGVRPRGLQRIDSQSARDFIELCLSRGNGEMDVSAEYLLDHPFLKASDDDNEMVRVRADDELERDPIPSIPTEMNAKSFADQLNLESASKGKDETVVSDRRKNNVSLSFEPEELASGSGGNSRPGSRGSSTGVSRHESVAEEKSAGKHHMMMPTKMAQDFGNWTNAVLPPLAPTSSPSVESVVTEPLSDKKDSDEDNHVKKFLSTMPGSESKIRNDRIAIMGGRNQRIEIDEGQIYSEDEEEERRKEDVQDEDIVEVTPPHRQASDRPVSAPLTVTTADLKGDRPRATTIDTARTTRPPSAQRNRGKRYEIKATKDPDNDHSILLNLRIAIDGKSKEIKFPFNLYTESPHEVACELAVDVGILEPDLEAIADSISFLVTEGKINDLPDFDHDIWDEAPEPHSFSTKPLPHVSKMSFGTLPAHPTHHFDPLPTRERSSTYAGVPNIDTSASHPGSASSSMVQRPDQSPQSNSSTGSSQSHESSVTGSRHDITNEIGLKPSVGDANRSPTRVPQLPHASSENSLQKQEMLPDLRERGISTGSAPDVAYMRSVRQFEDRVKLARSSTLEEAIRNEEEKHQRELDRIRKKIQQFNEKTARATQARQERMKGVSDEYRGTGESEDDGSSVSGRHSPPHGDDNLTRTISRSASASN